VKPPLPYYNYGGCPFECCVYRDWLAETTIELRKTHDLRAPVIFTVQQGEWVEAETGVVITQKAGRVKILRPVTLDEVTLYYGPDHDKATQLMPGDIIYTLYHTGEGYDAIWFKGETYGDTTIYASADDVSEKNAGNYKVLSSHETTWWAKIKNKLGQVGWTNRPYYFDNIDMCG